MLTDDEFEMLPEVDVVTCVSWDCPGCKTENLTRECLIPDEDVESAIRDVNDLESWEEVPCEEIEANRFMGIPMVLVCSQCAKSFRMKDPMINEDVEDDYGDEGDYEDEDDYYDTEEDEEQW